MSCRSDTVRGRRSSILVPPILVLPILVLPILVLPILASPILAAGAAEAGSCAQGIDRAQARLDRTLENRAAAGSFAPESPLATRGRQPTPATIAAAENRDDGWPAGQRAVAALARARRAEAAGKSRSCRAALRIVEREMAEREIARPSR